MVHLLENAPGEFDLTAVRELFLRKCRSKGLTPHSSAEFIRIVGADAELRSEWANMLAHQLPALPDLSGMLAKLPGLLGWIDAPAGVLPETRLASAPIPAGTISVVAPGIRYWGSGLPLEAIRFAGTNRLLVEFDYGRPASARGAVFDQARRDHWGSPHVRLGRRLDAHQGVERGEDA